MSDTTTILHDTANRLFADTVSASELARAAEGAWLPAQWQQLEELGLTTALVPEDAGGAGLEPADALGLVRLAGYHGLPLPLAETLLAGWLLAHAGLPVLEGPLTIAPARTDNELRLERTGNGWRLRGELDRVPWARHAAAIAALADHDGQPLVCLLTPDGYTLDQAVNLAGEPRDTVQVNCALQNAHVAPAPEGFGPQQLQAAGAALRALAMAGAIDRVLTMSVNYANERKQFGRPIGKFQAVQQNLAVLASQAAAAGAASDIAAEAFGAAPDLLAIAVAKVRTGEAAGSAAGIAHQVHGAIGFTEEHSLHFFTKRLWSWRDEFGREAEWNRLVGQQAADAGADGLWPLIASV
ncbi:MAG: acyl-CoA dehydrogenase family protein [Ectothiorhodospiraceae bacterium]|nr:acyl-CoA dehydrogenase family protein [Ectothiorhodospiraceae bacterium]